MELDWRYTDKHYPWQKVTKERLEAAYSELLELGLALSVQEKEDRIRRWVGFFLLGYEEISTGDCYLHPHHMDPEELTNFEPLESFEYLKTDVRMAVTLKEAHRES